MKSPVAFDGPIGRLPFALATIALLILQLVLAHLMLGDYWYRLTSFAAPTLEPFYRGWYGLFDRSDWGQTLGFSILLGVILITDWLLVALAFRRAKTIGASPFLAACVVVPYVQLASSTWLALKTGRPAANHEPGRNWQASVIGMLAGAGIGVAGVVFFTLLMREYGIGLFVGTPLLMGFVASLVAIRAGNDDRGAMSAAMGALILGSMALIGFALEGAVCLIMASPLILLLGGIGALLGRAWGKKTPRRQSTIMSVAVLPLLFGADALAPPHAVFESVESIEVAATPAQVWDSVVHMGPIPDAPAAPFGWGLAYPMRGTIYGQGVGAIREGVFSTGTAYERVTEWEPNRKLSFVVLSDPPTMKELSPYARVHAPHTKGYFKTRDARFTITPMVGGKTRLTLTTLHELDIGPTVYWKPWAEWAIHTNKRRVLEHFKNQAQRADEHAH